MRGNLNLQTLHPEIVLMTAEANQMLELTRLRRALARIHEQVASRTDRVEFTREGCDDVCVIISKSELESLEQALEILANTSEYRAMCEQVSNVAAQCGERS
jgi:PHD/YefM family antitoxin component YafN of YafNO toxin-antitoxin module